MQTLREFRSARVPLTNAELVRRTGLPKATVSRLTGTLLALGVVRHLPGKRAYELNIGRLDFSHAYAAASELLCVAQPFMQEIADELNGSVALGVRHNLDMLYVAYRASRRVTALRLGIGSVLPMGMTSIGRAYLWGLPAAQRNVLLKCVIDERGAQKAALRRAIRASFEELAKEGTCAVASGFQPATYGIAAPVRIGKSRQLMGLSFGRADARLDLESERLRVGPALRVAARELEARLAGFDGEP
jgi:DNA-binding IclR family transcriptional regulator